VPQYAWYYFAIFRGVIVGLMFEPLPGAPSGLIAVTLVAGYPTNVLFSPSSTRSQVYSLNASLSWALSGFPIVRYG